MANDPANPATGFEQGDFVRDVPSSFGERLGRVLRPQPGDPLEQAITEHHMQRLDQARMYKKNSNTAAAALIYDNQQLQKKQQDPNHPDLTGYNFLTDDQRSALQNQYQEAQDQFEKITGVNKDIKGAHAKARGIVDQLIQRPGGMQTPPTPQGPAISPQGTATSSGGFPISNAAGPNMTPPPALASQNAQELPPEVTLPFQRQQMIFQQGLGQAMQVENAKFKLGVAQRTAVADDLDLDKKAKSYFVATGHLPANAKLQHIPYIDPNDPTKTVKYGSYDQLSGQISDQDGNIVDGAQVGSTASMTPKRIQYKPEGANKALFGFQVGNKLYDQEMNELPPGTEAFVASNVPKTTQTATEKENALTGEREVLHSTKTTGPVGAKITGAGGYKAGGSQQAAPAAGKSSPAPTGKLSGPTGAKADQDARREAAYQKRNNLKNLTSSTRTMVEAAPKVEDFVDRISSQIDGLQNDLGPVAGRWNEFWAGKVGASNPKYTALRTDVGLLTTLLMRMHVGARGGEYIMKHFEDLINQGKQSPENLKAALQEIKTYADNVVQEGKDAGLDVGKRQGGATPPPTSGTGGFVKF